MPPNRPLQTSEPQSSDDLISITGKVEFNNKLVTGLAGTIITLLGGVLFNQYSNSTRIEQTIVEENQEVEAACAIQGLNVNPADPTVQTLTVTINRTNGNRETFTVNPRLKAQLNGTIENGAQQTYDNSQPGF